VFTSSLRVGAVWLALNAFLSACTERPIVTEPLTTPAFRTEQNPDGPGAFVIRVGTQDFFWALSNGAYTLFLGYDAEMFAERCATGLAPTPLDVHLVLRPNGGLNEVNRSGEAATAVWAGEVPPDSDICTVLDLPLVGQGTTRYTVTISDAGPGITQIGIHSVGNLLSPGGDPLHLVAGVTVLISEDSDVGHGTDIRIQPR
jgi:hypothetical protein